MLNYGAEFGYEPEFIATVRDRLGKLAPLPTGRMKLRPAKKEEIPARTQGSSRRVGVEPTDAQYAPVAEFLGDRCATTRNSPSCTPSIRLR